MTRPTTGLAVRDDVAPAGSPELQASAAIIAWWDSVRDKAIVLLTRTTDEPTEGTR